MGPSYDYRVYVYCSFVSPGRIANSNEVIHDREALGARCNCIVTTNGYLSAMADQAGALNWRLSAHPITLLTYLSFRIGMSTKRLIIWLHWLTDRYRKSFDVPLWSLIHQELVRILHHLETFIAACAPCPRKTGARLVPPNDYHRTRENMIANSFPRYSVLVFILTLLLLSVDFYYLKNIAGRRLVGLRWWNEVNTGNGESHWVFESRHDAAYHNASNSISSADQEQNPTDHRFFWLSLYVAPALWVGLAILAVVRLIGVIWLSLVAIALALTITNTVAFSRCDKFGQASRLAGSAFQSSGFARGLASNLVGRFFR